MALFSIRLNQDEEILTILRRHYLTFFGSVLQFLIILAIIFSFNKFFPDFKFKTGMIIGLVILAIIFLAYKFLIWYLVSMVITTERIIDISQESLTRRTVTEVALGDIYQISAYKEGIFQSIFNLGNLVLEVEDGGKIVGFNLKNPDDLIDKINQLRN